MLFPIYPMSNDLSLGQLLTRGIRAAFKVSEAGSPNDAPIQVRHLCSYKARRTS